MRRAITAAFSTVVGLLLLLSFKTGKAPTALSQHPTAAAPPAHSTAPPAPGSSPGPAKGLRTVTGPAVQIPFGIVQVRVTERAGKIAAVTPLQLPYDNPYSSQVSQYAAPRLAQEVLSAQSANINIISGATYTSEGYAQSLQAALKRLRA
ncbi:MAG: FMN-binding protein [Mycobacteriales bacterium]